MKVFGFDLFKKTKPSHFYDFAQHGLLKSGSNDLSQYVVETTLDGILVAKDKKKKKVTEKIVITPKGLYACKALNDNDFKIISDTDYIQEQVADAKVKLSLLPKADRKKAGQIEWVSSGTRFGYDELEAIVERLENRYRLSEFKELLDKYPHTSSALINDVVTKNNHLRCQKADSFVPDFPKEAISAMKEYNEMCQKLSGKDTYFYVIADKKDFEKRDRRRDPILLAQSPFGFFWQILGAWDEEMIYLGDL